jgi:hypothetical protein
MMNPVKVLAEQFVRQSPITLLALGITVSLIDFLMLYYASVKEGVLYINDGGVGLLNNYGLFSTIVGNAIFPFVAKKFYEGVFSMKASEAITNKAPIEKALSGLPGMIKMQRQYKFVLYMLIIFGALIWVSNVTYHVIGSSEIKWGHQVFDSPNHPLTFIASRLHNFYTWLVIMPLMGHIVINSSFQLKRAVAIASEKGTLAYDLLCPDRRGGFAFIEKVNIAFNVVVAIVYIQITLHYETFAKMNIEHIVGYITLTLLFVGINRIFWSGIYTTIRTLKLESLNKVKENVYKNDSLSFEILKYCYDRRIHGSSILKFIINPGAIVISGIVKLWPMIAKTFT